MTSGDAILDLGNADFNVLQPSDFQFIPYGDKFNTGQSISGSIEAKYPYPTHLSSGVSHSSTVYGGAAGRYLDSKGFGWLLEVEEDEDFQKPLLEELDIDISDIYYKLRCVLLPLPIFRLKLHHVRDSPDFWGPLFVVVSYALLSLYGQVRVVSWILTIWFFGSYVVFFLARVLGGEVSYSQCLGVIGYCLIPLVLTASVLPFVKLYFYAQLTLKIFGVTWAVFSAGSLLCIEELKEKRPLLWYPILLLYIYFLSLYTGV